MKISNISLVAAMLLGCVSTHATAYEIAEGCQSNQPTTDKRIFNWRYYLNNNADLIAAGISTPSAACSHWLNNGVSEGRQAHAGFHSVQYLYRYPDVANAFGSSNFLGAISHYVNNGILESRLGYQENGISQGRETSSIKGDADGASLFIGVSRRTAGAVNSLIYDNVEFINSYDHGRELQLASVSSYGENYNPTEAGSCNDGVGYNTSSNLDAISASGPTLSTTVTPAFWHTQPGLCKEGHNTTPLAVNHKFHKRLNIGIDGISNVVEFNIQMDINELVPQNPLNPKEMRFEVPTGYISGEFSKAYRYNRTNGTLSEISQEMLCHENAALPCEIDDPVVYATPDLSHAIGVCTGAASGGVFRAYPRYQAWRLLDGSTPVSSTTKWAVIKYIDGDIYPGSKYYFQSHIALGRKTAEGDALQKIKSTFNALHSSGKCT